MDFISGIIQRFTAGEFYVSLPFWIAFTMAVMIYRLVSRVPLLRDIVLLISSILMLLTLPRFDLVMLAAIILLSLGTFATGSLLAASDCISDAWKRKFVATAGVLFCVFALAFFKYRFIQALFLNLAQKPFAGSDFIFLIGISYSSFKAISFIVECFKGTVQEPNFLSFLNYILFFPSFISGPINRFNHWVENTAIARTASMRTDFGPGAERIILGFFKKSVLTVIIFPYTLKNLGTPLDQMPLWMMLLGLYSFALYLYFDFSGYTDLAIGSARVMGFVLPENFNQPFFKANIQQLWANFHISLTSWLTDYVYWPIARKLREFEILRQSPILLSNIAIVITFAVCGIWHGDTFVFLLWGIYHGIGLSVLNMYQKWKRKVRNPKLRTYFKSRVSYAAGVVGTFTFYSIGLLTFVVTTDEMKLLFARITMDVGVLVAHLF